MDAQKFQFINFTPNSDLMEYAERVFEDLQEHAPYYSHLEARVEKTSDRFWCVVDIFSHSGQFSTAATNLTDPISAVSQAYEDLEEQLWDWNHNRDLIEDHQPQSALCEL